MTGKPKRKRTVRREEERKATRLAADRERLFALEPGGSAARPIDVASASIVESRARTFPCPRCGAEHELVEHAAITAGTARLREARLKCRRCGSTRSLYFRLAELH